MLSVSIPPGVTEATTLSKELVDELAQQIRGSVTTRDSPEYVTCAHFVPPRPCYQPYTPSPLFSCTFDPALCHFTVKTS